MTALDLLMIGVVFLFGVITGVILLVSLASLREDRRARLSREAPDRVTHAGRLLTGLYVRRLGDDSNRRHLWEDDHPAEFLGRQGYADPEPEPRRPGNGGTGPGPEPGTWSRA